MGLPRGAGAVSGGAAQPETVVAAEWRLPHQLALIGTAGHREATLAGDRFGQNTVGAAARANLTRAVGAQEEYARVMSTRTGATDVNQLRATASLRVTRDLQLDGWAGRVTQDGVPADAQFGFGFTRRWCVQLSNSLLDNGASRGNRPMAWTCDKQSPRRRSRRGRGFRRAEQCTWISQGSRAVTTGTRERRVDEGSTLF